jgi:type I restriction enzyme, R subunit
VTRRHGTYRAIRRNRQITTTDLSEIERIFLEAGIGTEAEVSQAKSDSGGLGMFVRSLTGLDREASVTAFGAFQNGKTFTAVQLRFINDVIDYVVHNGTLEVDLLYQSPFNSIAPGGPEVLFPEKDIDTMVTAIRSVNATAVPT